MMYPSLVMIILVCSTTTLLHLPIHKHEYVPSTTLLAHHRLHPLFLPHSAPTYDQRTAHIWNSDLLQSHMEQENVRCHDIAAAQEIYIDFRRKVDTYSESDFRVKTFIADSSFPLARHTVGPPKIRSLTVLGWTDDITKLHATMYPVHILCNSPEFMNALYNIGRLWLGAATILPPKHIFDPDSPCVSDPDNSSTFRPKYIRYNPSGAPRSYVSRIISHTSHMQLIVRIRKAPADIDTAGALMCAILLDFMAYISYVISQQFYDDRVWRELKWTSNFVDNLILPDLPLLELTTMRVYVQPNTSWIASQNSTLKTLMYIRTSHHTLILVSLRDKFSM